ncbi:MAG: hypothetical protein IIX36_06855, partial [Clostridia bacterium]|nr:hypothetical protein [Clostridia bacterium]
KGTANAIYQNIDFIDRYNPDYVVVLSGDHIYKMDYAAMVEYHEKNNAFSLLLLFLSLALNLTLIAFFINDISVFKLTDKTFLEGVDVKSAKLLLLCLLLFCKALGGF